MHVSLVRLLREMGCVLRLRDSTLQSSKTGSLFPEVQHFILLYTILTEKQNLSYSFN